MGLLDLPIARRTRRNHAIEHATVHILTTRRPGTTFAGRSDGHGFYLYGEVDADSLRAAVEEAIVRLPAEPELAVHPYCGTNLVVGGITAGLASLVAVATMPRDRRDASLMDLLPRLLLAGTAAAMATTSLGSRVQARWTTLADSEGVRVAGIERFERGRHRLHRVRLVAEG